MGTHNIVRGLCAIAFCTVLPIVAMAQTETATQVPMPSVAVTPSTTPAPSRRPVVGRARNFSLQASMAEAHADGTLLVVVLSATGRDRALKGTTLSVDAGNAQILRRGKKNLDVSALVVDDQLTITGKVMPDGTYLAQHIRAVAKPAPKKIRPRAARR